MSTTATRCPRCGSDRLATTPCDGGPHYAQTGCADCGRFVRFEPPPWSLERAMAFVMPFGHHRGCALSRLTRTEAGREYLRWLAGHVDGNAGKAARVILGIDPIPTTDGTKA
jgi:hypothetical protein